MNVDDLEDANEHLLGSALVKVMRTPGTGVNFNEIAVSLIEAIKAEGWIPTETRDLAERQRDAAEQEILELQKVNIENEQEILKLQKQVAVLVSQLSSKITTTSGGATSTSGGIYVSPSSPWVTYTSSTTNAALPAAEVATQILRRQRRLS